MKKLFLSLAVAGMFAFFACGPSAEELAEKAKADSLKADSMAKAVADSIAKAEALKAADTTAVVDSTAKPAK
jgi:hypothetical protein